MKEIIVDVDSPLIHSATPILEESKRIDIGLEEEESTIDDIILNQGSKGGETLYNE